MSERITHAAELRRKAMCRTAQLRPVRARAARAATPSPGELHCGATLRHGVEPCPQAGQPETSGSNVSTQPTLFVDVAHSQARAVPQAFGTRTLSGVGAFDRAPEAENSFTPEYAPPLPDRPFLDWLKEAAAQQERQPRGELSQPVYLPTIIVESSVTMALDLPRPSSQLDRHALLRPPPLAARPVALEAPVAQPVALPREEAHQGVLAWVGALCALGMLALALWPVAVNAVAQGSFQRYSQLELAVSPLQAPVVAVHVVPGQRVQAGTPLMSLDASALEHELSQLNVALDDALAAQSGAQLLAAEEGEQLAQTVATLRERRIGLQRKLHSRQVVAAHSGVVTQVLPALGDVVETGAPVVRIVPDNPVLRLVTRFDARDAQDLRAAKHTILTLGADEMVVGAQVVRVEHENVELKLDDAASVPELDRQLQRDAKVSVEFERERSLLALVAERLRGLRLPRLLGV